VRKPVTDSQHHQVVAAWTSVFKKLLNLVRGGLADGYSIYPPTNSDITPQQYRNGIIRALLNDPDNPLAYMHNRTVNAVGDVIYGVLDHPFILHIVIRFVWGIGLGLYEFLDNPREQLDFTIAAVGAVAKLALQEQIPHPPVLIPFTQLNGQETFNTILRYIQHLDDEQKATFDNYKSHIACLGESQQQSTAVITQFDTFIAL
jgi:hypothetical protein